MTDNEVIKTMTLALRALNEIVESMEKSETLENMEKMEQIEGTPTCPICLFARNAIAADLEQLLNLKTMLIEKSNSSDKDEKLIAAIEAKTAAEETFKRCGLLIAFMEVAHSALVKVIRSRIEMGLFGENLSKNEIVERIMEDIDIPMPPTHFDPKKAN